MARQRHVFPTDEIPHLWAHKTQADARNPQENLYFKNEVIYSYRDSYPLASHVSNGKDSAVLMRTGPYYSVTTSGHASAVRSAIPSSVKVFHVPNVEKNWRYSEDGPDHETNLAAYVRESQESLEKAKNSRRWGISELNAAFQCLENAVEYARFFRLPSPRKQFAFLPKGNELKSLRAKLSEREERAKAKSEERRAKERARWEEQSRIRALAVAEQVELWKQGNPHAYLGYSYSGPTLLRVNGSEIETSKGARVPVSHAVRGLKFVRSVVASGQEYVRDGHSVHLGHYVIDRIEANGTLHDGCHVIELAEIERIAPSLEFLNLNVEPEVSEVSAQ
jgi:hypothetical protein